MRNNVPPVCSECQAEINRQRCPFNNSGTPHYYNLTLKSGKVLAQLYFENCQLERDITDPTKTNAHLEPWNTISFRRADDDRIMLVVASEIVTVVPCRLEGDALLEFKFREQGIEEERIIAEWRQGK